MAIYTKAGGTWSDGQEISVKAGGVWREAQEVFVKQNGAWVSAYSAGPCRYSYSYSYDYNYTVPNSSTNIWNVVFRTTSCMTHSGCCGTTTTCDSCCSPSCDSQQVSWSFYDGSGSGSGCFDQATIGSWCGVHGSCSIGGCCGADVCSDCNCVTTDNACSGCCGWSEWAWDNLDLADCLTYAAAEDLISTCTTGDFNACIWSTVDTKYAWVRMGGSATECTPDTVEVRTQSSEASSDNTDAEWADFVARVHAYVPYIAGSLTYQKVSNSPDNGANCEVV
jgi:hypothetical protein